MKDVSYKLPGPAAREALAALMDSAPWYARPPLMALLESLSERGIEIKIAKAKMKRSDAQAGYYWMSLRLFAKTYGCGPDEMHNVILCEAFGSSEVRTPRDVYRIPALRSSKLGVEEFSELIATLLRVAAFSGVILPEPE